MATKLARALKAQQIRAARAYRPGDPVRAKVPVNVGTADAPEIVAEAGAEGTVIGPWEQSPRMLVVQFGEADAVILLASEITPDWE